MRSRRQGRRYGAALVGIALAILVGASTAPGCSSGVSDDLADAQPISYYCNMLIPIFCAYASQRCQVVDPGCITNGELDCDQLQSNRQAVVNPTDGGIHACIIDYAGDDSGIDDSGNVFIGGDGGIACSEIEAGQTVTSCAGLFSLP